MAVDEEYLDNLLKTMTDSEEKETAEKSSLEAGTGLEGGAAYDLQSLLGDADTIDKGSSGMLEEALSNDDDWKFSLDDILAQADGGNAEGDGGHVVDLSNWEKEEPSAVEESAQQEMADAGTDIDISADVDAVTDGATDIDAGMDTDISTGDVDVSESFTDEPVIGEDWGTAEFSESGNEDIPADVDTGMGMPDFAYEDMAGGEEEPVSLDNINESDDVEAYAEEENADLADSSESMADTDSELAEINGLLKNTEKRDAADDDMLALLEGVDTIQMDNSYDEDDTVFDIFAEGALGEESGDQGEAGGEGSKGDKKKKKKGKLFGKKSKKEAAAPEEKENAAPDELDLDHLFNEALGSGEDRQEKKKAGFFTRAMEYLTQEEDDWEDELKENAESSDGTEEKASAKDKKKKKADKKKKKGKNKEAEEGAEENGEEEGEGAPKSKKKPKKEKKEKKEKPPKEKIKSVKVLSTKKLLVLIAFCATIVASVLVLANFLPEYADKQEARDAFYEGDYEKVYQLLYDKQLNDSDRIVFGRARVLLKLERKLQSYENNIALGREVEAVDALMRGMKCYEELIVSDVYGAREELDAIYGQICGLLNQYGVTPEEAAQINAYDEITYTKQLHALVEGAGFTAPGGEEPAQEPSAPQDLLPEEEDALP